MLNIRRSLLERAHSSCLRAGHLRHTAFLLQTEIDITRRRLRRVVESRRIIAGGQGHFERPLTFYVEERDDACVIHAKGEIDLSNARTLEVVLHDSAGKGRLIVLSLRNVEYLDASAIRVLERAYNSLRRGGARLVVAEASPVFSKILEIVRLPLDVFVSVDAALLNDATIH